MADLATADMPVKPRCEVEGYRLGDRHTLTHKFLRHAMLLHVLGAAASAARDWTAFDIATGYIYSPPWTTLFRGIPPEASIGLTSITIEAEHFRAEHVRPIKKILIASTRPQFLAMDGSRSECYSRQYHHAGGGRRRQHPRSDIACGLLDTLVSRGVHFRELSRILAVPRLALEELCVYPNEAMLADAILDADEVFAVMGGAGADASERAAGIVHNRAAARLATLGRDAVVRIEPDNDSWARKNRRMGSIRAWESVSVRVEGGWKSYRFGGTARACRWKWGRAEPRGQVFVWRADGDDEGEATVVWRFSLGDRHILDTEPYDMWPD